jgi:hypothetical protein
MPRKKMSEQSPPLWPWFNSKADTGGQMCPKKMKRKRIQLAGVFFFFLAVFNVTPAHAQQEDYLTDREVALLRDEFDDVSDRVRLLHQFLNRRFIQTVKFKTEFLPAPDLKRSPEGKENKKTKDKSKTKENSDAEEPTDPADMLPNSFLGWLQQYSLCLEDVETNLHDLPNHKIVLKPLIKELRLLDEDLKQQKGWVDKLTPQLKGMEKKALTETAEILQDLSPLVPALVLKYEAEQERAKQQTK